MQEAIPRWCGRCPGRRGEGRRKRGGLGPCLQVTFPSFGLRRQLRTKRSKRAFSDPTGSTLGNLPVADLDTLRL